MIIIIIISHSVIQSFSHSLKVLPERPGAS